MRISLVGSPCAAELLAALVDHHEVVVLEESLVRAGPRAEHVARRESDREVPVHCDEEVPLVAEPSETDELLPQLMLVLHGFPCERLA